MSINNQSEYPDRHDIYTMETDAELDEARIRASQAGINYNNPDKFKNFLEKEELLGFQSDPNKRPLSQRYEEICEQQEEIAAQTKRGSKGPLIRREIKLYESAWEKARREETDKSKTRTEETDKPKTRTEEIDKTKTTNKPPEERDQRQLVPQDNTKKKEPIVQELYSNAQKRLDKRHEDNKRFQEQAANSIENKIAKYRQEQNFPKQASSQEQDKQAADSIGKKISENRRKLSEKEQLKTNRFRNRDRGEIEL